AECRLGDGGGDKSADGPEDAAGVWRFVRGRPDKTTPNDISVVDKVIESIKDNVTKRDLYGALDTIYKNWKSRESQKDTKDEQEKPDNGPPPPQFKLVKLEWRSFEDYGDEEQPRPPDNKRAAVGERRDDGEEASESLSYSL